MTAKATRCYRYPCDTAHRQGTHKLVDGEQQHLVSVGSETVDVGKRLVTSWQVRVFAAGDKGPWQVLVDVHPWADQPRTLVFPPFSEPGREHEDRLAVFSSAVHRANVWALKYNLEDAARGA